MNRKKLLSLIWTPVLLTALLGCCSTIIKAEYPSTWPSRVKDGTQSDCLDISGSYKASNGDSLLPFFLYGIPDTHSLDWANLVEINEQILAKPYGGTVTIGSVDSDHIEVVVAINGTPIGKQILARSRKSTKDKQSFLCEPDSIVISGAYIFNWDEYRLPREEKKRVYRRPGKNDVGTSRGYYHFSKASNGNLVMLQKTYFCLGDCNLNEEWRQWEPTRSPTTN